MVVVRMGERTIPAVNCQKIVFERVGSFRTYRRVYNFQESERLSPFGEVTHAASDIFEAGQGNEEDDAP